MSAKVRAGGVGKAGGAVPLSFVAPGAGVCLSPDCPCGSAPAPGSDAVEMAAGACLSCQSPAMMTMRCVLYMSAHGGTAMTAMAAHWGRLPPPASHACSMLPAMLRRLNRQNPAHG